VVWLAPVSARIKTLTVIATRMPNAVITVAGLIRDRGATVPMV
jgi:hypothetical protein